MNVLRKSVQSMTTITPCYLHMSTCCLLYSITVTAASDDLSNSDTVELKPESDAMYY